VQKHEKNNDSIDLDIMQEEVSAPKSFIIESSEIHITQLFFGVSQFFTWYPSGLKT
jgi:hypothetical protein